MPPSRTSARRGPLKSNSPLFCVMLAKEARRRGRVGPPGPPTDLHWSARRPEVGPRILENTLSAHPKGYMRDVHRQQVAGGGLPRFTRA